MNAKTQKSLEAHGFLERRKESRGVLFRLYRWRSKRMRGVEESLDKLFKTKTVKHKFNPLWD